MKNCYLILVFTAFALHVNLSAQHVWMSSPSWQDTTLIPGGLCTGSDGDVFLIGSKLITPPNLYEQHVMKSSDNGVNWVDVTTSGLGTLNFYDNRLSYVGNSIVVCGSSIGAGNVNTGRMLKSTDKGATWNEVNNFLPADNYGGDVVELANGDWVLTSTEYQNNFTVMNARIYKSINQGSTWSLVATTGLENMKYPIGISRNGSRLFITAVHTNNSEYSVLVSDDNGVTWIASTNGFNTAHKGTDIVVRNNGEIYLQAQRNETGSRIMYRSTDNGNNWDSLITTGLDSNGVGLSMTISQNTLIHTAHWALNGEILLSEMDQTLSVFNSKITSQVVAFPNPCTTNLRVDFGQEIMEESTVELVSVTGQRLIRIKKPSSQLTINTSNLSPGVYFLELIGKDFHYTKKIIKQ